MTEKTYSVTELKTFIEAVEFAADVEEWIPSARQWKRIREMINGLETKALAPAPVQSPSYNPPMYNHNPLPAPYSTGAMPAVPSGPSAMSGLPPQNIGQPNAPIAFGDSRLPVRTPDIDTSNGTQYKSSFA